MVIGRYNKIEPDSGYGRYKRIMDWEVLHRVTVQRSPYNNRWQDALSIMECIIATILAQMDGASKVWRAVRESTRSNTVMAVVFNIPVHKLNGFGSGLMRGLNAFIRRPDYIGFGPLFSYDSDIFGTTTNVTQWQPTREGMLNVQINLHRLLHKLASSQLLQLHSIHIWVTSPSVKLIFMD